MTRDGFAKILESKILILDGAMGTLLQKHTFSDFDFGGHGGNYEYLNITSPQIVEDIHKEYILAGADIIETNTFSGNAISQKEYGAQNLVYEMNRRGAAIARKAADAADRQILVAGALGSMTKSLSIPSDINRPEYRAVNFDEMAYAYAEQVRGLIDGGADILLAETVYDALNVKAALYAIDRVQREKKSDLPVMISVTVNDKGGRLLSGHKWDAVFNAVSHYPVACFGFNCSFGAKDLVPFAESAASYKSCGWTDGLPCGISIYPNAGLPDEMGEYGEDPQFMAECLKKLAHEGAINIAGGCCGTTPEHIRAIAAALKNIEPRKYRHEATFRCDYYYRGLDNHSDSLILNGLETLEINREKNNFINVGERTNVAGSAKFAKLIRNKEYAAATEIACKQIEDGATVIDINTDDPMLDGATEMENFLMYLNCEPDIAKVPYMIDSSDWQTIVTALKNCGGKCIVNSISLKEGEEAFLVKAREIHSLGAAVVVMAFDEQGQAVTYNRKIEICRRAYNLLIQKAGFVPHDIIFDVNILSIATGIEEHDNYAIDFINAVKWIKENLKGCKTSGGVSNLSFSFRGNNKVREAMHSAFLYHAINAGLDMAIVNPSMLQIYDNIEPALLKCIEDVIFNRKGEVGENSTPTERLVELAEKIKVAELQNKDNATEMHGVESGNRNKESLEERLCGYLIKGQREYLQEDINEALVKYEDPVKIIEGPLMRGMEKVGELFGEGKMFLPQVVKSAKVMKAAVDILKPYMEKQDSTRDTVKILLATVKGDIHDIGKNIVAIVLECNNFEVEDLGVMIENKEILRQAIAQKVDVVGVSGLITPSLAQMEELCKLFESNKQYIKKVTGHVIPISVGGAATSALHTAVKLAPLYSGGVIYGNDASKTALIMKKLTVNREEYLKCVKEEQNKLRDLYFSSKNNIQVTEQEAKKRAPRFEQASFIQNPKFGEHNLLARELNIGTVLPHMNWTQFFNFWGFKGKYPNILYKEGAQHMEVEKLYYRAMDEIGTIITGDEFNAGAIANFYDAYSQNDEIFILENLQMTEDEESATTEGNAIQLATREPDSKVLARIKMPRQQRAGSEYLSASDYFPAFSSEKGQQVARIGLFALRVFDKKADEYNHKEFDYLLRQSLCAALTEGMAEWIQQKVSCGENLIRVAIGYPMCPDHSYKKVIFSLIDAEEKLNLKLTETYSIIPATAICGFLISHKEAKYFSTK